MENVNKNLRRFISFVNIFLQFQGFTRLLIILILYPVIETNSENHKKELMNVNKVLQKQGLQESNK